jgi:predicted nucleotide-binding protein (sugar kinase/HSP70/actin superfamily)
MYFYLTINTLICNLMSKINQSDERKQKVGRRGKKCGISVMCFSTPLSLSHPFASVNQSKQNFVVLICFGAHIQQEKARSRFATVPSIWLALVVRR